MTNQGDRQASVRAVTGTALTYDGDWLALFDQAGIPVGTFNDRLHAWINAQLGANYPDLDDAMSAYAKSQGASSWSGMGTFTPGGVAPFNDGFLLEDGVSLVLLEDGVSYLQQET